MLWSLVAKLISCAQMKSEVFEQDDIMHHYSTSIMHALYILFPSFQCFQDACANNSNVLHVDAFFLKNREQKLNFKNIHLRVDDALNTMWIYIYFGLLPELVAFHSLELATAQNAD